MDHLTNLRHLHHVVLLAEERHFLRAAARACLSQSAFSRSIQVVEDQCGMRLFDRGQGEVRPTRVGDRVVASARRLLASAADLRQDLTLLRTGDLGDVAVGAGPFSGRTLMTAVLAALHQAHPRVRVRLEVSDANALRQRLEADALDFFVAEIREVPLSDTLQVERLGFLRGGLYCRAGHPLAQRDKALDARDVRHLPFASVPMPEALARALARDLGLPAGLSLALECDSPQLLLDFVLRTDAAMFAIALSVQDAVDEGRLKLLRVRELTHPNVPGLLGTELGIVRLRHRTMSPAAEVAIELLREQARQRVGDR